MYVVCAWTATGVAKRTSCQPVSVSLVKLAVASNVPVLDQKCATCGPGLFAPL
jgi:hypothetical protein